MKKSQPKNKSSTKAVKVSAKKITGTSPISALKTAKKPSSAKTEKKTGGKGKATVPGTKAPAKKKTTSVSPEKTSGKKSVKSKTSKTVKKPEVKKPLKVVKAGKETKIKLSRPKTEAKPVAVKSATKKIKLPDSRLDGAAKAPKVIKTAIGKVPVKKPEKPSVKTAKDKKTPDKKLAKTISNRKSVIPEKPVKKSPVKIAVVKTTTTKKKTVKPVSTKKTVDKKIKEVAAKKKTVKTGKGIKVAAKTEIAAKKKTALKPKEKAATPVSPARKTVKKKGASSFITTEPLPAISEKTAATYIAPFQAETKPEKSAKLKIFLPEEELPPEEAQRAPSPQLPEEYGENELLLMEVDPSIVFVSWEIKPDDISGETGKLTLRVYDVTGIDFDGSHANRFFDISLRNRVDNKFIDIKMPGKDVIMEVGILRPEGAFKAIKQSNRVSMPALQTFEELGITGALSNPDTLIGY